MSGAETTAHRCPGDCDVTHDSLDWGGFAASVIAHHGLDSKENDAAAMVVFDEAGARALLTELGLSEYIDAWIVIMGMQSAVVTASATFDRIMAEMNEPPRQPPSPEEVAAAGTAFEASAEYLPMAPAPDGLLEVEPHPSHPQWVGIGDAGGALMCGSCGKDLDDDEAALPCSVVQVPPAISALFDAWAKRTGAIFTDATRMTSRLDIVADLLRGVVWLLQPSRETGAPPDRDALGMMACAKAEPPLRWESLSDTAREEARRIGEVLFAAGRASREAEIDLAHFAFDMAEIPRVAQGIRLSLEERVVVLLRGRDEARDWVRRMQAENVTTCIHCGTAYPPGTPTHGADALREHARVCEKHPMRAVEAAAAVTQKLIADLRDRDRGAGVGHTKQCRTKHGRITCDCGWADLAARLEAAS